MKPVLFDLETEPLPYEQLEKSIELPDPEKFVLGEFDPNAVKIGNLKDEKKIEAKIEAAREKHEKDRSEAVQKHKAECEAVKAKFVDAATLDACFSKVCVLGYFSKETDKFYCHDDSEATMLTAFWEQAQLCLEKRRLMVGHNIFGFDLPYLFRRSVINSVAVPHNILQDRTSKWPRWNPDLFVDTRKVWLTTSGYMDCKSSIKHICGAMNLSGKVEDGGITGGDFWKFYRDPERKEIALRYLEADLREPAEILERMGVCL